ncbi:radical SAM protein [Paenibacillus sp. FSL R7-0302]|uniref:B12-binding domain-containing radical SAM protein n=1 Tax=Paenibacillus sp. FSL R7-0302 TaxID=2921681 RepID=UPI0030F53952
MRIACILPHSNSIYRHKYCADYVHMSGLITIREFMKKKGHDSQIFDFIKEEGEDEEELTEALELYDPDIVCICGMFCIEDIYDFMWAPKNSLEHRICIAIGTGALDYAKCLESMPMLDYVIPVNPEEVLMDIINIELGAMTLCRLEGAAYKDVGGDICFAKRNFSSLDDIMAGVDVRHYISSEDPSMALVWSSRGCWYKSCIYCNVGAASTLCKGGSWICRDITEVVADLQILYELGIQRIHFLDAEFIGPGKLGRKRVNEFAELIRESEMKLEFYIDVRADCIDYETIKLLKDVGLHSVFVGVESVSSRELSTIKKGYGQEKVVKALDCIKKAGIGYRIGSLLAVPDSTLDDIDSKLEFYLEHKIYEALNITGVGSIFHELHLHLGTPIYKGFKSFIKDESIWEGEVPCYYMDGDVQVFIAQARIFQQFVLDRYVYSKDNWNNPDMVKRYHFSLRIIALSGLRKLISAQKEGMDSILLHEKIVDIFKKHDHTWTKMGGNILDELAYR